VRREHFKKMGISGRTLEIDFYEVIFNVLKLIVFGIQEASRQEGKN